MWLWFVSIFCCIWFVSRHSMSLMLDPEHHNMINHIQPVNNSRVQRSMFTLPFHVAWLKLGNYLHYSVLIKHILGSNCFIICVFRAAATCWKIMNRKMAKGSVWVDRWEHGVLDFYESSKSHRSSIIGWADDLVDYNCSGVTHGMTPSNPWQSWHVILTSGRWPWSPISSTRTSNTSYCCLDVVVWCDATIKIFNQLLTGIFFR